MGKSRKTAPRSGMRGAEQPLQDELSRVLAAVSGKGSAAREHVKDIRLMLSYCHEEGKGVSKAVHEFLKGSEKDSKAVDGQAVSAENRDIERVLKLHEGLCASIAPATPRSLASTNFMSRESVRDIRTWRTGGLLLFLLLMAAFGLWRYISVTRDLAGYSAQVEVWKIRARMRHLRSSGGMDPNAPAEVGSAPGVRGAPGSGREGGSNARGGAIGPASRGRRASDSRREGGSNLRGAVGAASRGRRGSGSGDGGDPNEPDAVDSTFAVQEASRSGGVGDPNALGAVIAVSEGQDDANTPSIALLKRPEVYATKTQSIYFYAAVLGAALSGLFTMQRYLRMRTFDPNYVCVYVIRFTIGVVAGVILANMGSSLYGDSETLSKLGPSGIALLGGYSAEAVRNILDRLVQMLVTAVEGHTPASEKVAVGQRMLNIADQMNGEEGRPEKIQKAVIEMIRTPDK